MQTRCRLPGPVATAAIPLGQPLPEAFGQYAPPDARYRALVLTARTVMFIIHLQLTQRLADLEDGLQLVQVGARGFEHRLLEPRQSI